MKVYDSVAWAHDHLLPHLPIPRRLDSLAIHPVCSLHHLGLVEELKTLGAALAKEVTIPIHASCCGFAGDRGFLHPELSESAIAEQAGELRDHRFDAYLCSNRTCEIGLNHVTGANFRSIIFLLEELSRPEEPEGD
jgi:D-lactate dehydrogenase